MKNYYIYIIVVVAVVILGLIFWSQRNTGTTETSTQNVATTTEVNTTSNTLKSPTSKTSNTNTSASKPKAKSTVTTQSSNSNTSQYTPPTTPVPAAGIPQTTNLSGLIFKLSYYNDNPVNSDLKYTISFDNGVLSAKFCNNMSGNYVLDGNLIKVNNLTSTKMYCSTPSNSNEIESAFTSMLNFGATLSLSDNTLTLISSSGTKMVFVGF